MSKCCELRAVVEVAVEGLAVTPRGPQYSQMVEKVENCEGSGWTGVETALEADGRSGFHARRASPGRS